MAVRKIETELTLSGEKQFNDQMKAVNSNLKTLKSEMALVSSEFEGQANTVDALREKQRVLTDQYDQQKEKVKALEEQLSKAKDAYGENSAQADKYQQQVNNAKVQLNKFGKELEDTNKYLQEAETNGRGAADSIDEFGKEVKDASDDLDGANGSGGFGGLLGTLGEMKSLLVGGAVVGALKEVGEAVWGIAEAGAAYADDVLTMSTVTGLSTETLQEFMYMTDLVDVSVDTITGSLTKLTRNMESARDGTGSQAEAFQKLGIEVVDANGNLREAEDVFYEVIDKLGDMTNETERDATAMELMGKSAQDLNPIIELGSEGLDEFRQEAHDVNAVLDEESLATLGAVQDSFDRLKQKTTACKNQLAIEFAPSVIKVTNEIADAWDKVTNAIINAYNWMTKTEVGKDYKTGTYSNITGQYTKTVDPDEEYYGTGSYLDNIKNGRHAAGLNYVPFDGYVAELHKGERVLSAQEAASATEADAGGTQVIEVHSTIELDKNKVGEAVTRYQAERERKFG